ncbi:MAG: poly-gamma-glutamate system protein [Cloacibacillus evryensis]
MGVGEVGAADETADPDRTGLIGFEWSGPAHDVSSLPARTSCDLAGRGDGPMVRQTQYKTRQRAAPFILVALGPILNTLTAAEARGVKLTFVLSLGSSSWGANVPKATWPEMAAILRRRGLIRSAVYACTPGGDRETGGGLSDETIEEMRRVCRGEGTRLVIHKSLEEVRDGKMDIVHAVKPKVVINLGGSESNMGGRSYTEPARRTLRREITAETA